MFLPAAKKFRGYLGAAWPSGQGAGPDDLEILSSSLALTIQYNTSY